MLPLSLLLLMLLSAIPLCDSFWQPFLFESLFVAPFCDSCLQLLATIPFCKKASKESKQVSKQAGMAAVVGHGCCCCCWSLWPLLSSSSLSSRRHCFILLSSSAGLSLSLAMSSSTLSLSSPCCCGCCYSVIHCSLSLFVCVLACDGFIFV